MSDMWREDPNSDSHDYVAQSNIGGWSRISSHPVVPMEPVGTLTVRIRSGEHVPDTNLFWSDDLVPEGEYLLIPVEADDG